MPKQDGGPILRSHRETCRGIQHTRPRQLSGNSTTIGSRTKDGILGDPHPGLNSSDFFNEEEDGGRRDHQEQEESEQQSEGTAGDAWWLGLMNALTRASRMRGAQFTPSKV